MVNMVDTNLNLNNGTNNNNNGTEKLMKTLITQFCDQQFKFTLNLKILGSVHVIVDNNEVVT